MRRRDENVVDACSDRSGRLAIDQADLRPAWGEAEEILPGLQYEDSTMCQLLYHPPSRICNTVLWPEKANYLFHEKKAIAKSHSSFLSAKKNFKKSSTRAKTLLNLRHRCHVWWYGCSLGPLGFRSSKLLDLSFYQNCNFFYTSSLQTWLVMFCTNIFAV